MSLQSILSLVFSRFAYFSKEKLLLILKDLILNYKILDKKYEAQKLKNKILEEKILEFESKETKEKIKDVNKSYSKPTSKQPEWEDKGVGNDGKGKKKRRGKKGRKGRRTHAQRGGSTISYQLGGQELSPADLNMATHAPISASKGYEFYLNLM